ncbi:hypothetical protein ADL25_41790 [Streptomyces sp. NRRL F-5122]|nr:hypothetical protein ADL25_41790 [Streptomyces sp. NRRL F-5122]
MATNSSCRAGTAPAPPTVDGHRPAYGEVTVRRLGAALITSEPIPARTGTNGSLFAAACRPHMNIASSTSSSSSAPLSRAAR